MKKQNNSSLTEASTKVPPEPFSVQFDQPLLELILDAKAEIEALGAKVALEIIRRVLEEEISEHCGQHGRQSAYRHGSQAGYVVYAGRKVQIQKPRARRKGGEEIALRTYEAFQQNGRMQRAVARKLKHQFPLATIPKPLMIAWRVTGLISPASADNGKRPPRWSYARCVSDRCPKTWWPCSSMANISIGSVWWRP